MRKVNSVFKMMIAAMICGVVITGCGGGGGGGKSGLKENEYLGSLPALFADLELAEDAAKEKLEKVKESGNYEKYAKLEAEEDKAADERNSKFQEAAKAEWEKVNGREIPFSCSEAFKKLNIQIGSVKLDASYPGIVVTVTAKKDFTVNNDNVNDYRLLNYRVLAKDNSVIDKTGFFLVYLGFKSDIPLKQGEAILFNDSALQGNLQIHNKPQNWVDFASIEFVTVDEYLANN